jgi:S-adenosylmethionine:tRNA ribosyltransferase-isomerase
VHTADFNFDLPPELIAQTPASARDDSRLLVLDRGTDELRHSVFKNLPRFLRSGDVLVLNDSRVIPARLAALNSRSGSEFEVLLIEENRSNVWWALIRPAKRAPLHTELRIKDRAGQLTAISATVIEASAGGLRRLLFQSAKPINVLLSDVGQMPLPPYIRRGSCGTTAQDFERYQTVYAHLPGSVAAPTAGLHFTLRLLSALRTAGVRICFVTLHVGPGTFAPVRAERLEDHVMHEERFWVGEEAARLVNAAKAEGQRVIAVGTTSARVLETVGKAHEGRLVSLAGRTRLFVHPPYHFQMIDALLTNFHLPCSTLLMLVSAFAAPGETTGRDIILTAYQEAIRQGYRFFSYGDAMLIV